MNWEACGSNKRGICFTPQFEAGVSASQGFLPYQARGRIQFCFWTAEWLVGLSTLREEFPRPQAHSLWALVRDCKDGMWNLLLEYATVLNAYVTCEWDIQWLGVGRDHFDCSGCLQANWTQSEEPATSHACHFIWK